MVARRRPLSPALVLTLLLGACATGVPPGPAGERDEAGTPGESGSAAGRPEADLGAAGSALVTRGVNERRAGDYAQAAATLERALRIEPGSAAVWLELARVRLAQGDYVQAGQLARKAGSLATGQPALAAASQAVLAEALERQGQSP
jgi:Tfp pilus assembly protein PilF